MIGSRMLSLRDLALDIEYQQSGYFKEETSNGKNRH